MNLLLKGTMHEIFEQGVFTQVRPLRVGDLGKKIMVGVFYFKFYRQIIFKYVKKQYKMGDFLA
jgi:hypothetical protein